MTKFPFYIKYTQKKYIEPIIWTTFWLLYLIAGTFYVGNKFGYINGFKVTLLFAIIQGSIAFVCIHLIAPNYLKASFRKIIFFFFFLITAIFTFFPIAHALLNVFLTVDDPLYNYFVKERGFTFYFVDCAITVAGLSALVYAYRWVLVSEEKRAIENQKFKAELKYLKAQINPHFLFNTLNSVYALALKKSDDTAPTIHKISHMMRYLLYETPENDTVPLSNEITYIQNYIDLENIRYQKADIRFTIFGEKDKYEIYPLILLPFIENSFKHGIHKQINNAFVNIHLHIEKNQLILLVHNSKPSTQKTTLNLTTEKVGGIGLANVRKRLALCYPDKHQLTIEDRENSYEVHLKLQLT